MIKLQRLQDAVVKGNFTIKCDTSEQIHMLHDFFWTFKPYIRFKDITMALQKKKDNVVLNSNGTYGCKIITMGIVGDTNRRFIIKYENLEQLLKLREIFKIRANKFDMKLIEKRGYNMFTVDFYKACENTDILKVRK